MSESKKIDTIDELDAKTACVEEVADIDAELERIGRRELKYLSRSQLLEILLEYAKENEKLRDDISNLDKKLNDKRIKINSFGSIAEASIGLNDVFASAEAACAQYIENAKLICDKQMEKRASQLEEAEREAAQMLEEAKAQCADIEGEKAKLLNDTYVECEKMKLDTETQCSEKIKITEINCNAKINRVEKECKDKIRKTEKECSAKIAESDEKVKNNWDMLSQRLEAFYESHNGLIELVNQGILNIPGRGKVNET